MHKTIKQRLKLKPRKQRIISHEPWLIYLHSYTQRKSFMTSLIVKNAWLIDYTFKVFKLVSKSEKQKIVRVGMKLNKPMKEFFIFKARIVKVICKNEKQSKQIVNCD